MSELDLKNLASQAKSAYEKDDYAGAAQLFEQAAQAFDVAGAPLDAAEMKNNASVAWLQAKKAKQALSVLAGTVEIFGEAGDLRRQGLALGNEGAALEALNRNDEAAQKFVASAELLEQSGDDQMRAEVMKALSALQVKTGKPIDAFISMQVGVAGVQNPTFKQRILKILFRLRTLLQRKP